MFPYIAYMDPMGMNIYDMMTFLRAPAGAGGAAGAGGGWTQWTQPTQCPGTSRGSPKLAVKCWIT